MKLFDRFSAAVDTLVGVFAPAKALERSAARKANEQFSQAFRGARNTRLMSNADALAKDKNGKKAIDHAQENEKLKGTPAYWKLHNKSFE